jgi:uncharacterized protein
MSKEKNASEEEYFARIERENREKAAAAAAVENEAAGRAKLKALHHQRCGKCGGSLAPRDFQGVEIDVCGGCGAVLLDPGELETLAGSDSSGALASLAGMFRFRR